MTRLLVIIVLAIGVAHTPPGDAALEKIVELRADRRDAGKALACERRAIDALMTEDPAQLADAQRLCESVWGDQDPRLPAGVDGP